MLDYVLHLLGVVVLDAEPPLEGLGDRSVRYALNVPVQDELNLFVRVFLRADHDGKREDTVQVVDIALEVKDVCFGCV